jgi:hypothetical protein
MVVDLNYSEGVLVDLVYSEDDEGVEDMQTS